MQRKIAGGIVFLAALGLVACSSSGLMAGASGMNLLIITMDTTRADVIDLYGNKDAVSPNIDRLGREGIVFRECYSPAPLTLPAHCSLFTGRYPIAHHVRNNGTYVLGADELTLAEVLKEQGYQTAAVIASFTLSSKFGLNQGFDVYDEDFESGQAVTNYLAEIPADRVYGKFVRWLDRAGGKFFCWVHFYDPHSPYVSHGEIPGPQGTSPWSLYEGEVRFVDSYIGKMMEALRAKNLFETTVIVIVGDHGEAFGEHKERGHGIFCYEESLRVPLIIHNPKVFKTPHDVPARVSLVDIMPSILALYKLRTPPRVQGRSFLELLNNGGEKSPRTLYFESLFGREEFNWAPLTGLIDGHHKYISLPEPELYDLQNDGRETRNLFDSQPDTSRAMDKKLQQFILQHAAATGASRRDLSASDVEKLKTLGYISSFSSRSAETVDPKKVIDVYLEVVSLKELVKQKNYQEAEERLAAVLARNPGLELPDIYEISSEIAMQKGKTGEAAEILQKAIGRYPEKESFKMFLAMDYIESGDLARAGDFCRRLLADNDKMTGACILLGDIEDRLNNPDAALLNYEKAGALEPQNGMIRAKSAGALVKKGELSKAQTLLEELEGQTAIVKSPEYMQSVSSLGMALLTAGETERALALFKKVTVLEPGSPAVWLNLGYAYYRLKKYDLARENFEKSLALDKNFALAYSNIGLIDLSAAMEKNDPALADKSVGSFSRAIGLQPELAVAWNGRASARLVLNQTNQAISDYERAIKIDPDLLDAYINLNIALRQAGRYAEALKYLDICRERLYSRLEARDREEIDRLYTEIKALKDGH
ncbi:MAG: sulfatase-like hydrolase/transferase [Candidatus Aminicenantales bacterium]|jgi:arylsulfatase A-like enzyme/Flp pilus assembly protein TadD